MKSLLTYCFIYIAIELLLFSCARPSSPTGGPRDTIPPVLLSSVPVSGALNFSEQTFEMNFSEAVSADQLKQKLLTSPRSELKYKTFIKKERLTIKFEEPFQDTTTYYFNFSDGVVDITEKNPAENLSLAFSTGPYIDSIQMRGTIKELMTQQPAVGYTVALYNYTDTLDLLTASPTYFTTTNDTGYFQLDYIKVGTYKTLAFLDENNNVIFNSDTEPHGFIEGKTQLDSSAYLQYPINTLLQNVDPIKSTSSRSIGPYIEVKYNKPITRYTLQSEQLESSLFGENNDGVRIYKPDKQPFGDTIEIEVAAYDTLGNVSVDTIRNVFLDNYRKPTSYKMEVNKLNVLLQDTNRVKLVFNKPTYATDSLSIRLAVDSNYYYKPPYTITWNDNHTSADFIYFLSKQNFIDSVNAYAVTDTTQEINQPRSSGNPSSAILTLAEGSFLSIEQDTSMQETFNYALEESTSFGILRIKIQTDYRRFEVQLMQGKEVAYRQRDSYDLTFSKITPGKYEIRVLIDVNENGTWETGNLLDDTAPEKVYIFPEPTEVRENWDQEINISF